jgi:hypothetical protein
LAVQFISLKEAGFNRKATRGQAVQWLFLFLNRHFYPGRAGNPRTKECSFNYPAKIFFPWSCF